MTDEKEKYIFKTRDLIEEVEVTIRERTDFIALKRQKRTMPEEMINLALYRIERLKYLLHLMKKKQAHEKNLGKPGDYDPINHGVKEAAEGMTGAIVPEQEPEPEAPPPAAAAPVDDFDDFDD